MSETDFTIDLKEPFEYLPKAPIIEAVIHWRARSEKELERDDLLSALKDKLPDYPESQPQHKIEMQAQVGPRGESAQSHSSSWHGFRFDSDDKRHVAQFTRNGFVFSRLAPYQRWESFEAEAQRLWKIYAELAEPSEIQQLGVRFINRIAPVDLNNLGEYLARPPKCPGQFGLPLQEFMHQDKFDVPGHPYSLNVIQTIQPAAPTEGFGLILDIDVTTTQSIPRQDEILKDRLREMRWLKDKAFFTFLNSAAIDRFKE
jgi:uncharacterized protein (TIGR04255 family)